MHVIWCGTPKWSLSHPPWAHAGGGEEGTCAGHVGMPLWWLRADVEAPSLCQTPEGGGPWCEHMAALRELCGGGAQWVLGSWDGLC